MNTNAMTDVGHTARAERRIDAPVVGWDLPYEIARLRAERAFGLEGHAGRTLTKYADLRVVLEAARAGVTLPFHETAHRMSLQVMLGQVRVRVGNGEPYDVGEGGFAAFEVANVHQLEILQDSAFLLTLAWPAER
jgi:hypothetical protein